MITNDIKKDFKKILVEDGRTLSALAGELKTTPQYLSRLQHSRNLTLMFVSAIEALGYDIKLTYSKRKR